MGRATYLQKLIINLRASEEPITSRSLSKKESFEQLKYHTGQDFGDDVDAWEKWVNEHPYATHKRGQKGV